MTTIEEHYELLVQAAKSGNTEEVRRVISLPDVASSPRFKIVCGVALLWSAQMGHSECIELLGPLSDTKSNQSNALRLAAEYGHAQCVALLIPFSDPKENSSYSLQKAYQYNHQQCADLLYPVSDPEDALIELKHKCSESPEIWMGLEARIQSERLNAVLSQEIDPPQHTKVARKI